MGCSDSFCHARTESRTSTADGSTPAEGCGSSPPRGAQGASAELTIPSHLGYGPNGTGPIPGGATLIFRVELIKVEGGAKE